MTDKRVKWDEFFDDPYMSTEQKWAAYPSLVKHDEALAGASGEAQQAWFDYGLQESTRRRDTASLEQTGQNLQDISIPHAASPMGAASAWASNLGRALTQLAPQIQAVRQEAKDIQEEAPGPFKPLLAQPNILMDMGLEAAQRVPKAGVDTTRAMITGAGTNMSALNEMLLEMYGQDPIGKMAGQGLIDAGLDPAGQMEMPDRLTGTGTTAKLTGEVAAQLPVLSALGLGSAAGGPAGGFAASQSLLTGNIAERMSEETGGLQATAAAGLGALGALPEQFVFLKALKGVTGSGVPGYVRRVFNAAVGEGATEAYQQTLERSGVKWLDPDFEIFSEEGLRELAEAAKQGFTLGGLFGVVGIGSAPDLEALQKEQEKEQLRRRNITQPMQEFGGASPVRNEKRGRTVDVSTTEGGLFQVDVFDRPLPGERKINTQSFGTIAEAEARANELGPEATIHQYGEGDSQRFDVVSPATTGSQVDRQVFSTMENATRFAEETTSERDPQLDRVREEYAAQGREDLGSTVNRAAVNDPQINSMAAMSNAAGMPVNFYVDQAHEEFQPTAGTTTPGVRAVRNRDGSLSVRYDQSNPEATSAAIARALVTETFRSDPGVAMEAALEIEKSNPELWAAAKERAADPDNDIEVLAEVAELSFRDVMTAIHNPQATSNATVDEATQFVQAMTGVKQELSKPMRAFVRNMGFEFALPNVEAGGLLHALRTMPGYMKLVQDTEGLRAAARSASTLANNLRDAVASDFDPEQPLVIRHHEGETGAADITHYATEKRTTAQILLNKVIYPNMGIEDVEKRLREKGAVLDDSVAAALERDLRNSKTVAFIEKVVSENYKPAMDRLGALPNFNKKAQQLFRDFLAAWSSEERNAEYARQRTEVQEQNLKRGEGEPLQDVPRERHGGLTNESITEIYDRVEEAGLWDVFNDVAPMISNMHNETLNLAIKEGVITRADAEKMRGKWSRYLPLHQLTEDLDGDIADREMDELLGIDPMAVEANQGVTRQLFHDAEGRTTEGINDVIEETVKQLVIRAQEIHRQRSIRTLANLARRYSGEYIKVEEGPPQRGSNGEPKLNELGFRENGREMKVVLKPGLGLHTGMAEISPKKRGLVNNFFQKSTRLMSSLATTLSPAFWFVNLPRDLLTAGIQTDSDVLASEIYNELPSVAVALSALEADSKIGDPETRRLIKEAEDHGIYMSFMGLREMQDVMKLMMESNDMGKIFSRSPAAAARLFVSTMENVSGVIENTTRMAGYVAARKAGYTANQAAAFGRRLTVDFGRRTEWSSDMNDYFMFFNAGIQGTSRIFETVWSNENGRKMVYRLMKASMALALYNEIYGGDDDDTGEKNWVKMQDSFDRSSNLVIMKPDFSGEYWKIPVPPGFSFFTNLGYKFNDWTHGRVGNPMDETVELVTAALEEFSPISGGRLRTSGHIPIGRDIDWHSGTRWLTPDAIRPVMDVVANKNQWGTPIRPERYGKSDTRPDSELYFNNVNPMIKAATDKMNSLGAGSKTYPGELFGVDTSFSPETLEHMLAGYTTGLGMSFLRGTKLADKIGKGEDLSDGDIPVWRRFHGQQSDFQIRDEYHAILADLTAHNATREAWFENHESVPIENFNEAYGWKNSFAAKIDMVNKSVNKLKKAGDHDAANKVMKQFVHSYSEAEPD